MRERNLYQRGGIWWLRATVNGVERRESLRVRDVKIARKLRDAKLDEFATAAHHGQRKLGWKESVTAWAEHVAGQIAQSTARRYAVSLLQCEPYLAKLDVRAVDGRALQEMVSARRRLGASPATIRRDLTAVSRVLEFSEAQGWSEGNPTLSKRKLLKERRDPITLPEASSIEAVIASSSPRFGAMIQAAWLTGCRQNELVTATWRAFNHRAGTLEIVGKGNKRRTIKLSHEATAQLAAQPRTLGSDLIFCREGGLPYSQALSFP
jgi:integrase/recombinase XerD